LLPSTAIARLRLSPAIGPRAVDVWYVLLDDPADAAHFDGYLTLLSTAEREVQQRFRSPHRRMQYVVARALVRTVLSGYVDVDPRAWSFRTNAYGRPQIAEPRSARGLRFSLAHTHGLVACAVTRGGPIGIDVENLTRSAPAMAIAERFFAPAEAATLRALSPADRHRRFLEYWTLKEAYAKARGFGVTLPFDSFAFDLQPVRPIALAWDTSLPRHHSRRWQFDLVRPSAEHVLALAARPCHDLPIEVRLRSVSGRPTNLARRRAPLDGKEAAVKTASSRAP
jgi:4'-phosphopantetheinyl transferase